METEHKLQTIKSWAAEDRPREKFILKGADSLSDAELLAILIGTGSRTMSAVDLAKLILKNADNELQKLAKLSIKDLMKTKGVGEAKAITIAAALELGKRRKEIVATEKVPMITAKLIYNHIKPHLYDLQHEESWIILLDRTLKEIKTIRIGIGGTSITVIDPKIVFRHALENLANFIVLVHNHPSGGLNPSTSDKAVTQKIKNGAALLDIILADHLIFTNNGFYSFNDAGEL
ncbi:MAG: DNA repair protein RadC [Bacteroidetes bacterium]|nr:MAG: DNA repair protein RadC [Bacteroidota bacterium]